MPLLRGGRHIDAFMQEVHQQIDQAAGRRRRTENQETQCGANLFTCHPTGYRLETTEGRAIRRKTSTRLPPIGEAGMEGGRRGARTDNDYALSSTRQPGGGRHALSLLACGREVK